MTLAFGFANSWLLLGLLAAAIPVVLHLLSSVRAPQMVFPTLRFLRISMEKTARRRRVEHWLLLLVRSVLLALLALAVAEPILKAAAGFWADQRFAAVVILDNSYSMAARSGGSTRLVRARREATALLDGQAKPTAAAIMLTNAAARPEALTAALGNVRDGIGKARLASGRAPIGARLAEAARLLADETAPQKAIYIFSDLQAVSFRDLEAMADLKEANIPIMLVDCSGEPVVNVGLAELKIAGRRIAGQRLEFTATLVNSSPTDQVVEVFLQVDGRRVGQPVRQVLSAGGQAGATAAVRFYHRFSAGGVHVGRVAVAEDDALPADNVRRFSIELAEKVRAVLVRGGGAVGGALDPAAVLQPALDPYEGAPGPWSVRLRTIEADQFGKAALADAEAVLLADLPSFTAAQADDLEAFVRRGGTAVIFLGPGADVRNYNDMLVQRIADFGGLLPGRIESAVGQVGVTAEAVTAVKDLRHPYLAGLYETPADYPEVLVQRYYRLGGNVAGAEKVLTTPAGDALVAAKDFGDGRVVLFATTASAEWNNLSTTPLLLPMATRICLAAGEKLGADHTVEVGTPVTIRPRAKPPAAAAVNVKPPAGAVRALALKTGPAGPAAVFADTHRAGIYEWQVAGAGPEAEGASGAFATNIDGVESDLAAVSPAGVAAALSPADLYSGQTLEEVHAAAADAAVGDNLWDRFLAVVIGLLVVEAVVANRFRRGAEPVPVHLQPGGAG